MSDHPSPLLQVFHWFPFAYQAQYEPLDLQVIPQSPFQSDACPPLPGIPHLSLPRLSHRLSLLLPWRRPGSLPVPSSLKAPRSPQKHASPSAPGRNLIFLQGPAQIHQAFSDFSLATALVDSSCCLFSTPVIF